MEFEAAGAIGSVSLENLWKVMGESDYPDNAVRQRAKGYSEDYAMMRLAYERMLSQRPSLPQLQAFQDSLQVQRVKPLVETATLRLLLRQITALDAGILQCYEWLENNPISRPHPGFFALSNKLVYLRELEDRARAVGLQG
jgi:hypothetical protein